MKYLIIGSLCASETQTSGNPPMYCKIPVFVLPGLQVMIQQPQQFFCL